MSSGAPPIVVYDVISDLRAHLIWSAERVSDKTFKLLSLEGPDGRATEGTAFTSSGAHFNGTFRDRSVVTEAVPGKSFVIETDAHLDRKHGKPGTCTSSTATRSHPKARDRRSCIRSRSSA